MHQSYRTALVTGASSGIGERLARLLAADGCDLVVVARQAGRLAELAAGLRDAHHVQVEVLAADLTTPAGLLVAENRLASAGRPVELLVNNAGFGLSGPFADVPADSAEAQIRLNVLALVRLTHAVLPGMLQRGHGGVLNVSSVAGFLVWPGGATYAATKAFVTSFSESVHTEVADRGVHVTALCPGLTRTGSGAEGRPGKASAPAFAWLDPDRVARAGLDAVAAGRPVATAGAQYKAMVPLARIVPRRVLRIAGRALRRDAESRSGCGPTAESTRNP
jgi:short-subunit dehydrogenase